MMHFSELPHKPHSLNQLAGSELPPLLPSAFSIPDAVTPPAPQFTPPSRRLSVPHCGGHSVFNAFGQRRFAAYASCPSTCLLSSAAPALGEGCTVWLEQLGRLRFGVVMDTDCFHTGRIEHVLSRYLSHVHIAVIASCILYADSLWSCSTLWSSSTSLGGPDLDRQRTLLSS